MTLRPGQTQSRPRPLPLAATILAATIFALTTLATLPTPATTQRLPDQLATLSVPRFPIAPSPIELTGPVRPGEYLGVTGPRAAWLGLETGEAELWVHPLKVARGFRLGFSTPSYGTAIPGDRIARTVQVRPEVTTITYSHAAFQVRQHILAPRDTAAHGILVLLEVDSAEPMEIVAEFHPVLNYMWPGSIGGQYAYWDAGRRLFVLSESLQTRNAVVGSPWATNSVEHPAHQLGDAPRTMVIPVDPERARREFIPIAVAAGNRSARHRLRPLRTFDRGRRDALPGQTRLGRLGAHLHRLGRDSRPVARPGPRMGQDQPGGTARLQPRSGVRVRRRLGAFGRRRAPRLRLVLRRRRDDQHLRHGRARAV